MEASREAQATAKEAAAADVLRQTKAQHAVQAMAMRLGLAVATADDELKKLVEAAELKASHAAQMAEHRAKLEEYQRTLADVRTREEPLKREVHEKEGAAAAADTEWRGKVKAATDAARDAHNDAAGLRRTIKNVDEALRDNKRVRLREAGARLDALNAALEEKQEEVAQVGRV